MLYPNYNSTKAKLLYDLNECEVRGNYISESILLQQQNFTNFNNKPTSGDLIGESNSKLLSSDNLNEKNLLFLEDQKENISSNCLRNSEKTNCISLFNNKSNSSSKVLGFVENVAERFSFNKFDRGNNLNKNSNSDLGLDKLFKQRLNYEIEIQHPFLEKCVIRGSNILEAFDLHRKIQQIIAEFD